MCTLTGKSSCIISFSLPFTRRSTLKGANFYVKIDAFRKEFNRPGKQTKNIIVVCLFLNGGRNESVSADLEFDVFITLTITAETGQSDLVL